MKKIRVILSVLLIAAMLAALSGCFVIRGQKMHNLKGTYKLTNYTYTPQYEYKGSPTRTGTDYINDEKHLWEDYLVITDSGMGYYIHKAVGIPAYVKEVSLSYEYSEEDSSKIEYVVFKDVLTTTAESGKNRVGVNGNVLNYSKSAMDIPKLEILGGGYIRTEDISVRWEKVDDATDLSYVKGKLGELKEYDYTGYGARGIYELNSPTEIETGNAVDSKFQYLYYVVDTAKGVTNAKVYYALKETPTQHVEKTVPFSGSADWSTLTIDGTVWTREGNCYYSESEGLKHQITCVDHNISDERLQELIDLRTPVAEE